MAKGKLRQNEGPCAICSQQGFKEKFRKLTRNLLARVKEHLDITDQLQINDQLCQLHYNNYISGDANNQSKNINNLVIAEVRIFDPKSTTKVVEREEELIESNKEGISFKELLEDNDNESLDDVNSQIENKTESINKMKVKYLFELNNSDKEDNSINKEIQPKKIVQVKEKNDIYKCNDNIPSVELIHN
ncbi:11161_t:CDS:2 [Scutellospora calospora]|uniref:11161_t:CDS:1 n=1 Tax=Scutellospora calospora TaxID=85575 RepID=A0ACA9JXR4_9GLOM|nr:11161_t:CDS:2 [Scutellospora calospora]